MTPTSELDAIREHGILSALAGFPILITFAFVWTTAGALSYIVEPPLAAWLYLCLGLPAMPIAITLERRLGYVSPSNPDPLLPLTLQLLFVQIVAFPAILLVWDDAPPYVPVAFAAIVGAHFLPFQWVYRTKIYGILGVIVAVGPFVIAVMTGEAALHHTGFFVGATLLAGAFAVKAHARATWIAAGKPGRE